MTTSSSLYATNLWREYWFILQYGSQRLKLRKNSKKVKEAEEFKNLLLGREGAVSCLQGPWVHPNPRCVNSSATV